jgi:hypothetical protein
MFGLPLLRAVAPLSAQGKLDAASCCADGAHAAKAFPIREITGVPDFEVELPCGGHLRDTSAALLP